MILCADDFGLSPAVSDAILSLAASRRVSSVSCRVVDEDDPDRASTLRVLRANVDVGLQVVLTDAAPLSPQALAGGLVDEAGRMSSFRELAWRAYRQQVQPEAVRREVDAQIRRFVGLFGSYPDYLVGHLHVQQLPVIRKAFARSAARTPTRPYVRVGCVPPYWLWHLARRTLPAIAWQAALVAYPAGRMCRTLRAHGVSHNRYLLGQHGAQPLSFRSIFRASVALRPGTLDIFQCHPGLVARDLRKDPEFRSRAESFDFLASQEFWDALGASRVALSRFSHLAAAA